MIEAESVANLLTHNELPPWAGIVGRRVEIRLVELHDGLSDVTPARPDLRDPEPAVIAIGVITNLNASSALTSVECETDEHPNTGNSRR